MSSAFPELSPSLGFWVKHQAAMEAFEFESDNEEPIPRELQEIFESEKYGPLLERIHDAFVDEGDALVHAIANAAAAAWAKHPELVVERKRRAHDWMEKMHVRRKWARGNNSLIIGFRLETNTVLGPVFYCSLWSKGGKAAAESNVQRIREKSGQNVMKGSEDGSRFWNNGVILLARIPLSKFLVEDDLQANMFFDYASSQIARCTGEAMSEMLK